MVKMPWVYVVALLIGAGSVYAMRAPWRRTRLADADRAPRVRFVVRDVTTTGSHAQVAGVMQSLGAPPEDLRLRWPRGCTPKLGPTGGAGWTSSPPSGRADGRPPTFLADFRVNVDLDAARSSGAFWDASGATVLHEAAFTPALESTTKVLSAAAAEGGAAIVPCFDTTLPGRVLVAGDFEAVSAGRDELRVLAPDAATRRGVAEKLVAATARVRSLPCFEHAGPVRFYVASIGEPRWFGLNNPPPQMDGCSLLEPASPESWLACMESYARTLLRASGVSGKGTDASSRWLIDAVAAAVAEDALQTDASMDEILWRNYISCFPTHPTLAQTRSAAERETLQMRMRLLLPLVARRAGSTRHALLKRLAPPRTWNVGADVPVLFEGVLQEAFEDAVRTHVSAGRPIVRVAPEEAVIHARDVPALDLVVAVSSKNLGFLDVCGCVKLQSGGLARRKTVLDALRAEHGDRLVYADLGDYSPKRGLDKPEAVLIGDSEVTAQALARMRCDFVVPSLYDLSFGPKGLGLLSRAGVAALSVNARRRDGAGGIVARLVHQQAGLRIGMMGITAPANASTASQYRRDYVDSWTDVGDPASLAAAELDSGSWDEFDAVVVLGQLTREEAAGLLRCGRAGRRIVAFVTCNGTTLRDRTNAGGAFQVKETTTRVGGVPFVVCNQRSYGLDVVRLEVRDGKVEYGQSARVLDSSVELDSAMRELVLAHYRRFSSDSELLAALRPLAPEAATSGGGQFVGAESCRSCHEAVVAKWTTSGHGRAFKTLQQRQVEYLPQCYSCHVTGFQVDGGYRPGETRFEAVQCEVCHGAGEAHVKSAGRTAMPLELPGKERCAACHYGMHSPSFDSESDRFLSDVRKMCRSR